MKHETLKDVKVEPIDFEYKYQGKLTPRLDDLDQDFNQEIINEIVLWKVNRYALIDEETQVLLNQINKKQNELNKELTIQVLEKLLGTSGIRLPMASTILRFKNPNVYQIIDQRVYRLINDHELKLPYNINDQIELYLDYLEKLRLFLPEEIEFSEADRVLYEVDKRVNKSSKLKNYG